MEFYDRVDSAYLNAVKRPLRTWRIKVELLDHYENTIKCIERDIDYSDAGNIVCNNVQGSRRTCNFTLNNIDSRFIPTEDNPFWYNRKFRVYIGIVDNRSYNQKWTDTDIYWFSKGVYITQDMQYDSTSYTMSITGIDKYAQLDGTLNVLQADEMDTVFQYGSRVSTVVEDILMLDMGNGQPLDPIAPIIDPETKYETLYKEYTINAGQYYGDFLNELATSFGCDIFYDTIGRLILRRSFTDNFAYWIAFKAPVFEFKYGEAGYENPKESVKLSGINKLIVATDNVETPNASYTAINHNPQSPLCYDKIGARTLPENGGTIIINAGNIVSNTIIANNPSVEGAAKEQVWKRCRDYAEYRLMQETCLATTISFTCPPYLHLCEGDVIAITDPDFGLDCDLYVINSITFPLGTDSLQLEVSNVGFLNSDLNSTDRYTPTTVGDIQYGIHYILTDVYGTAPPNQLIDKGNTFTTATDYDEKTHDLYFWKDGNELIGWKDNINENDYELNAEYPVPNQSFTMYPIWKDISDYILEMEIDNVSGAGYNANIPIFVNGDLATLTTEYSAAFITLNDNKKYYYWGRNVVPINPVTVMPEVNNIVKIGLVPVESEKILELNTNVIMNLMTGMLNGGRAKSVKYPNAVSYMVLLLAYDDNLERVYLPKKITLVDVGSNSVTTIKEMYFNNENEVTMRFANMTTDFLSDCPDLDIIEAVNHVTLDLSNGADEQVTIGEISENVILNKMPDIKFPKGLTVAATKEGYSINKVLCFGSYYVSADSFVREIVIGSIERNDPYMGGLELTNTTMLRGNHGMTILTLDNVYMNSSRISVQRIGKVTLNGNIKLENGSSLFERTYFTDNNVVDFNGKILIDSSYFLRNTSNTNGVEFKGDFECKATTQSFYILTNNAFQSIKFYGKVHVDFEESTSGKILCDNSSLTDLYFYNDDFVVKNYDNSKHHILENNNANLVIHGQANGNVQAFAESIGVHFEVIVDE